MSRLRLRVIVPSRYVSRLRVMRLVQLHILLLRLLKLHLVLRLISRTTHAFDTAYVWVDINIIDNIATNSNIANTTNIISLLLLPDMIGLITLYFLRQILA